MCTNKINLFTFIECILTSKGDAECLNSYSVKSYVDNILIGSVMSQMIDTEWFKWISNKTDNDLSVSVFIEMSSSGQRKGYGST